MHADLARFGPASPAGQLLAISWANPVPLAVSLSSVPDLPALRPRPVCPGCPDAARGYAQQRSLSRGGHWAGALAPLRSSHCRRENRRQRHIRQSEKLIAATSIPDTSGYPLARAPPLRAKNSRSLVIRPTSRLTANSSSRGLPVANKRRFSQPYTTLQKGFISVQACRRTARGVYCAWTPPAGVATHVRGQSLVAIDLTRNRSVKTLVFPPESDPAEHLCQ